MVSVKVVGVKHATAYYTQDDYYLDQKSYWWGEGRKGLGLEPYIKVEDWKAICAGEIHGKKLNGSIKEDLDLRKYRAGVDLTFSAPKSLSILAMSDKRFLEAHQRAVENTLKYVQGNLAFYRQTEEGVTKLRQADNIMVGCHLHQTSRELQPQIHSHAVIINTVVCEDGKRRALLNDQILANTKNLGQFYRNDLALECKKIGCEIKVTDRVQGFFEIKGVSDEILKHFSLRRQQVKAKILELKEKYPEKKYSDLTQMAVLNTRKTKKKITQEEFLKLNEKELKKEHGVNSKDLLEVCLNQESEGINKTVTPEKALKATIEAVGAKRELFTRETIVSEACKYGVGEYSRDKLEKEFKILLESETESPQYKLIDMEKNRKGKHFYTTKEYWNMEKDILQALNSGKTFDSAFEDRKAVDKIIKSSELENSKNFNNEFHYTENQKEMIRSVLSSPEQFVKVQGDAGAGKTAATKIITDVLQEKGYDVKLFAPTGKAAKELTESTGIEAWTIETLRRNEGKLKPKTVLFLDEAGMAGVKDIHFMMRKAEKAKCKFVPIGDVKQFKSISAGDAFSNLDEGKIEQTNLSDIRRQKTQPLKDLVQKLKEKNIDDIKVILETNKLIENVKEKNLHKKAIEEYFKMKGKGFESAIITKYNKDVDALNKTIREQLKLDKQITNCNNFEVLQDKRLDEIKKNFIQSYKQDDILITHNDISDVDGTNIEKGKKLKVLFADEKNNKLLLRDIITKKHYEVDPLANSKNYVVYKKEVKELGKGDQVVFLKNDRLKSGNGKWLNVQNGAVGEILKTDQDFIHVKTSEGTLKFSTDPTKKGSYQFITHGYSITEHKSQGATIQAPVCLMRSDYSVTHNAAYVSITRCSNDLKIVTDNKKTLLPNFKRTQEKENILSQIKETANEPFKKRIGFKRGI